MNRRAAAFPWQALAFCLLVVAWPAAALAQERVDLLDDPRFRHSLRVSAFVPKVHAQVRCLRSDDEARAFCFEAWGDDRKELHVDFAKEQVLVIAWGRLRCTDLAKAGPIDLHLERATIEDGVLRAAVRSVLPPGAGIDVAPEAAGRDLYPSLIVRTPRTARCVVEVYGARRRDRQADLCDVTTEELTVRVAPDACPARERFAPLRAIALASVAEACGGVFDRAGERVFELSWGQLGEGSYRLDLVGAEIEDGTARLVVRAENREIMVYSGPGQHRPSLALALPEVQRVLVRVERVGLPLATEEIDFAAQQEGDFQLTVDRAAVRKRR